MAVSRENLVKGRLFLSGRDDRAVRRPRPSLENRVRESSTLADRATSAREARHVTERMCAAAQLSQDVSDRAVLLTSELVTDALLHSCGDKRFSVATWPGGVRVEVGDDSTDLPIRRPDDDADAAGGRGVQLLELCSTSWGARLTTRGKCVWCEVHEAS
jgi:hypothetical protein